MKRLCLSMLVFAACAGSVSVLGTASAAGGPGYRAVPLTSLGGDWFGATAFNQRDQVVGDSRTVDGATHAFRWQNGVSIDLGALGLASSHATDINAAGQVVGYANNDYWSDVHAFLWRDGVMTDLGTLGGTYTVATAINDAGQVIGTSATADGQTHAFIWQDGVMTDLGTLGGTYVTVDAINNAGQIVGGSWTAGDAEEHAFLWQDGVMADLGRGFATAINARGAVAGSDGNRLFYWEHGVRTDFDALGGGALAEAMNERGQVVGFASLPGRYAPQHAFLWQDGVMTDLGESAGTNTYALAVDNRGLIAGNTGDGHVVVWENGVMTDLGEGGPGQLNQRGDVLGATTLWLRTR